MKGMTMATTRIRGTALAVGVSKNNRYYSREVIARAVRRAQDRIRAGTLNMLTDHASDGDSTRIVGRVTAMTLGGDGSAQFEAELADTSAGRDIASLVNGPRPFLRGVSIRGAWAAPVRKVSVGSLTAETADDLELFGIDFTDRPGIPSAMLVGEAAPGRVLIYEEAPAPEPVAAVPTARELAAMDFNDVRDLGEAAFAQQFAAMDAARRGSPSPFWRGLDLEGNL
jgi:hypothetical protein